MRGSVWAVAAALSFLAVPDLGLAQTANQASSAKPMVVLGYYKVRPNRLDEWIELFKKWHLPVLEDMKRNGEILDAKFYTAGHRRDWDFSSS